MTKLPDKNQDDNMIKALQQVADAQTTIMNILQVKSEKDEERDQKIDTLTSDMGYLKQERELTTTEFALFDHRRKSKVYEMFGKDAEGSYRGEKIFGNVLDVINIKVRQRARLARPMKATQIRDYHDVMDAIDAIQVSEEEVRKYIDKKLDKREDNKKKIWK
ncbi:hypothetical protein [uncultured Anaerococcus sp.]|uniref:hypothetical protein n=1 Tax=uncultured Anaerococcus sp. TaxID=293428 RepID=UPI002803B4B5|nr:hypothetical protein [uncultured Anaerococcus sp.]